MVFRHRKLHLKIGLSAGIVALILGFSGCGAYFNTFYNARKLFNQAEKKRIEQESKNRTAQQSVGRNNSPQGGRSKIAEYDKAIEKCSKVLQLYPKSRYIDDAIMIIGQSFYHKGEYLKAKRKFEELITLLPNSPFLPEAQLWLARTLIALQNFGEAESVLGEIVQSEEKNEIKTEALLLLGNLYVTREDYKTAIAEFEKSIQISNDHDKQVQAQFQIGQCYLQLNDYEKASTAFKRCLDMNPSLNERFTVELNYALALRKSGLFTQAVRTFERMTREPLTKTEAAIVRLEIARTLAQGDDEEKARIAYEDLINNFPRTEQSAIARYELARLSMTKGDFKEALLQLDLAQKEYNRSSIRDSIAYWKRNLEKWDKNFFEYSVFRTVFNKLDTFSDDTTGYYFVEEQSDEFDFQLPSFWAGGDSLQADSSKVKSDSLRRIAERDSARADSLRRAGVFMDTNNQKDSSASQFSNQQSRTLGRRNLTLQLPESRQGQQQTNKMRKKVKVPKSPSELRKVLIESSNQLAELYFLQFENMDSALVHYDFLMNTFPESDRFPQWAYTTAYILDRKGQKEEADSLKMLIIKEFPESEFADHLRKEMNLEPKLPKSDPAEQLFLRAESLLFEESNSDSALVYYEQVIRQYPESEYAPKSLYSIAYIYDWLKYDTTRAGKYYREIIKKYPNSSYAKVSKTKIAAAQQAQKKAVSAEVSIEAAGQSNKKAPPDKSTGDGNFDDEIPIVKSKTKTDSTRRAPPKKGVRGRVRGDEISDSIKKKKAVVDSTKTKVKSGKGVKKGKEKD